ncbi:hypothetical protein P5V34_04780 [Mycobacteroides abscessus subsp. abscessus]|jgi:hypothetical protein|uniref:hypothetical protein n=1 Tax=Mycobacteroides abscessus TaxID=36809 RepID=UPI00266CF55B|nr:hypothetical protein [Mycobacteroides abscessus]MDO3013302.1 hypothetical protein [Mycobacteroides abscessus subsp. abscessus]
MTVTTDLQPAAAGAAPDARPAEDQFIGALLWLTAPAAQPLVNAVPTEALWHPLTRWVYELIADLVAAGRNPTPIAVLTAGMSQPAHQALHPTQPPGPRMRHELALYLFDAYSHVVEPRVAAGGYAADVLAQAYRRAYAAFGTRMHALATGGADIADMTANFAATATQLADLTRRTTEAERTLA